MMETQQVSEMLNITATLAELIVMEYFKATSRTFYVKRNITYWYHNTMIPHTQNL